MFEGLSRRAQLLMEWAYAAFSLVGATLLHGNLASVVTVCSSRESWHWQLGNLAEYGNEHAISYLPWIWQPGR